MTDKSLVCKQHPHTHTHPPRSQQGKQVRKTRQTYVNAKTLSRRKRNCKWPWVQKEPLRSASNILRLLKNWMYKYQNKTKILKSNLLAVKASSFIWQGPAVEFGAGTSPKVVPMVQVWIGQRNLGSPPQVYAARKLGISKKKKQKRRNKNVLGRRASTQMTTLLLAPEGSLYSAFTIPGSRRTS